MDMTPQQARNEGMARAEAGADQAWIEEAESMVRVVAAMQVEFTSDDIWLAGLSEPREPRALGPVLARLQKDGVITKTKRFVYSVRVERHAADIVVWRSNICPPLQRAALQERDIAWAQQHQLGVTALVMDTKDVDVLREVARLVGYKETR